MKKLLAILITISLLFAFAACGEGGEISSDPASSDFTSSDSTSSDVISSGDETSSTDSTSSTESQAPTSSTESVSSTVTTHTHTWSSWTVVERALLGKDGSEKRTCSGCSETETRKRTECAVSNSFFDGGLQYIFNNGYGSINGSTLLDYACHEFHEHLHKDVTTSVIFDELSKRFTVTEQLKNDMIGIAKSMVQYGGGMYGYNEANNTFNLQYQAEISNCFLVGYIHNGGNSYSTYYKFSPFGFDDIVLVFEVELEYNKLNGKPNKYISVQKVAEAPSGMVAVTDGGRAEID